MPDPSPPSWPGWMGGQDCCKLQQAGVGEAGFGGVGASPPAPLLLPCASVAQGPDTTESSAAAVRHLHFPQCKVI